MSDVRAIDVKRAAKSIAGMVDEFTQRGWNSEGRENFALIVEKRLRRFTLPNGTLKTKQDGESDAR